MLYIIEIPRQRPPGCWTAASREEFVTEIAERARATGSTIIDQATPRQLIEAYGLDSLDEARQDETWIAELADQHGLDTMLYQANDGDYQNQPIDAFLAHEQYLRAHLEDLRIFEGEAAAIEAVDNPKIWEVRGGTQARQSLQRRLSAVSA